MEDIDLDGVPEVVLSTAGQVVAVKPSEGAGIGSWDVRAVRHALAAVLRRRPEASHESLVAHERGLADQGGASVVPAAGVGSIHDRVSTKEAGLAGRLHVDQLRASLRPRPPAGPGHHARRLCPGRDGGVRRLRGPPLPGRGDAPATTAPCWVRLARDGVACTPAGSLPVRVEKTIAAGGDRRTPTLSLEVRVENRGTGPLEATLAVEWVTTMLGGGGNPAAWYLIDGERVPHDSAASRASLRELRSGNDDLGLEVATRVEPAAEAWISPIDTVSNSEAGFERVYQGSALVFAWPLVLPAGAATTVRMEHAVSDEPRPGRGGGPRGAAMTRGRLAIHAHFYQPERRDPFGGRMRPDPGAAPYASWNERITAECYRPNAERGNLDRISFNVGPTLTSFLASDAPDVLARAAVAARNENALAQGFHHAILPLASGRDRRTEVRWGIRDYEVRFGQAPHGFWLPETAVDEAVLRTLAEEGIRWTILAPWQAATPAIEIPAAAPRRPSAAAGRSSWPSTMPPSPARSRSSRR